MKTVTYEGTELVGISADDVLITAHREDGQKDFLKLTELLDNMMVRLSFIQLKLGITEEEIQESLMGI